MYCEYGGGGRRKDGNGTLTGEGVGSSGRNKCWGVGGGRGQVSSPPPNSLKSFWKCWSLIITFQ